MEFQSQNKESIKIRRSKRNDCLKYLTIYPLVSSWIAGGGWAYYGESPALTCVAVFLFFMSFIAFSCSFYLIITTIKEGTGIIYGLILQDDGKIELTTKNFLFWKGRTVPTDIKDICLEIDAMSVDMPTYNCNICYSLKVSGKCYYILYDLFSDISEINHWLLSRKPDYKVKYYQCRSIVQKLYKEYESTK